jgi:hypothetical protein
MQQVAGALDVQPLMASEWDRLIRTKAEMDPIHSPCFLFSFFLCSPLNHPVRFLSNTAGHQEN